jgi:tetratricopeptide (TPR) repeat protein
LWNDGKLWHWRKPEQERMPAVVEALLEQQVIQAKSINLNRYVLESKAILPLDASDDLWQRVARVNPEELDRAIRELNQHGILKDKTFAHPSFKEVTVQTLDKDRRQHLARRAIYALEHDPVKAALFVDDARLENNQSLALLKKAANYSEAQNSLYAAKLLSKAVNYATGEEKHELALNAAELLQSHDMPTAIRLAEEVFKAKPTDEKVIELLAMLYAFQVREEDALTMLEHLPAKRRNSQEGIELEIMINSRLNKLQTVIDIFTRYKQTLNFSPTCIASVITAMNESLLYKEAEKLALKTLKGLKPKSWSYVSILHALAFLYNGHNHYQKAEPLFKEAITLIETHHNSRRLHIPLYNHALSLVWLLRFPEAKVEVEKSKVLSQEADDVINYCSAASLLGQIEYELGNYEKAEALLLEVAKILALYPSMPFTVDVHSNLTELYLTWTILPKNSILALKHAHLSLKAARQFPNFVIDGLYNVAIAESAYGNPDDALAIAEEAQHVCSEGTILLGSYYALVAKANALEALKRFDEAKGYFEQAAKIAQEGKLGLYEMKSNLELARLNNDLESAREHM